MSQRTSGRGDLELRPISLEAGVSRHAEGSCLARFGDTQVLCMASVEDRVPPHVFGTGAGWVTAEYGMLPRSTHERMAREAAKGKQGGRTLEIQRLIGRALRAAVDVLDGAVRLDLDYGEDSTAEVDMNVVATGEGELVEVQGTAEGKAFRRDQLDRMIDAALTGIARLKEAQERALAPPT